MGTNQYNNYTFLKSERINSEIEIQDLFTKGERINTFPFRLIYLSKSKTLQNSYLISVPKKKFKRAVDRNLLKRRIREACRLHKDVLNTYNKQSFSIGIVYLSDEIHNTDFLSSKLKKSFLRLINKLD